MRCNATLRIHSDVCESNAIQEHRMSAEALAIALNHSKAKGTAKVVLLGIANHDGDGGAWPSVQTLARYANVDSRNVQRAIDQLERLGEVRRIRNGGGTHLTTDAHRPNLYRILLQCPPMCDRTTQHRTSQSQFRPAPIASLADYGVAESPGVANSSPGGATAGGLVANSSPGGVALAPPEPPLELTTHLSETNPSNRGRASAVDVCREGRRRGKPHLLLPSGYCSDCGAKGAPELTYDRSTGEVLG